MEWPEFRPWRILSAFNAEGADYVVIGGIAAVIHGSAQLTHDLDICYRRERENLDALGRALISLDAHLRGVSESVPFVADGRTLRRKTILCLETVEGPVDLLAAPDGAPRYDVLRRRAEPASIHGADVHVASLEDLVAMKRAAGRPKDLIAIEELEVIARLREQITPAGS